MDRFFENRHKNKKQKKNPISEIDMPLFGQTSDRFLSAPVALVRRRADTVVRPRDDVDEFLSSDLEISFASTVSLNSPPKDPIALTPEYEYAEPMDISPAPPPKLNMQKGRPRAFTSGARLFGNDMSNCLNNVPALQPSPSIRGGSNSAKRIQRSALPTEWLTTRTEVSPATPDDDAMDVDTSSFHLEPPPAHSFPQAVVSAAPTVTTFQDAIDNLFYESMSPRRGFESPPAPQPKKRRSLSPDASRLVEDESPSSPALPSSPAPRKSELRKASGQLLASFTYPVLKSADDRSSDDRLPPTRRAFSAMLPPAPSSPLGESSGDSSFDMTYAKRQQMKTIRRCDGINDFRPLTGATAMIMNESPSAKFMVAGGMPGFGDNKTHGKILPCHRIADDGLMRITPETMDQLLDGHFEDHIRDYHIIDCRFDYEYAGGHIPGAVNINTASSVEDLLLGPSLMKPKPSVSGDSQKKTVLIFHCEFSAKRAPTFAKHLRSKDRAMNNHVYPKIHYPELYILEGGYCSYFKRSAHRCEPPGYVCMDDPQQAVSRKGDLDQFRKNKFGRHKSYAYGDGANKLALTSQQIKRNSAPTAGPPVLFSAATDSHHTTEGDETDLDLGDSPCPPPTKSMALKTKKGTCATLSRAETYGPTRMPFLGC
ncbi:hypothetical protein F5878DRAFT_693380 [Lentinula raphanica]|uniref:M-phase inducer phosphatase n=1 Tax=Lentinula raphanica TaxID=153919 RepID=A0AA38PLP5_9AGAR|nr:hypothetical protein F5878DRAFT_693380 [Lentinula raphanica]